MRASQGHYFVPLFRRAVGRVVALFNYLTLLERVTVTGRVVDATPNVTANCRNPGQGERTGESNDVLFQIDPAPFQHKLNLANG